MGKTKNLRDDVILQTGWLQLSLATLILWGLWGFLAKIVLNSVNWKSVFLFSTLGSILFTAIFFVLAKPSLVFNLQTCSAMLVGVMGVSASMAFYYALESGKVSIVVPLTAMYPLVTVILAAVVLREKLSPTQGVGVLLAIVAVLLISIG
jgi:transporter family protein